MYLNLYRRLLDMFKEFVYVNRRRKLNFFSQKVKRNWVIFLHTQGISISGGTFFVASLRHVVNIDKT